MVASIFFIVTCISQGLTSAATVTSVSYLNNRRREKNDLVDRLVKLITTLSQMKSSKKKIDHLLEYSFTIERSEEYIKLEENIIDIVEKCRTFILKYNMIIGNHAPTETMTREMNPGDLHAIIVNLQNLKQSMRQELLNVKWKRHPLKSWKLAKCSRDIAKYNDLVVDICDRLTEEHMTTNKNKLNSEKLNEDANVLPVFNDYAKKALDLLHKEGKSIIGIHGLPGVGKTTVLKRLRNRLIEDGLQFQHVIWINYPVDIESKESILQNLQIQIMTQLSIHRETTMSTTYENKEKISKFLRDKVYLLLMDQVSCHVNLDAIGLRDDNNGMNVVIAASDRDIVSRMTKTWFQIEGLVKDHAWTLFEKIYGIKIDDCNIEIGKRIVEYCEGIPIYIIIMATYLKRDKNEWFWRNAMKILKSAPMDSELLGLGGLDQMYQKIYQGIQSESAKKCLLYGALFPIQHRIYKDYLVECWVAEGFFDTNEMLEIHRDRGETILNNLTETYLMQWCSGKRYVKMQSNFRRVALKLVCPEFVLWVPSEVPLRNQTCDATGIRMSMIGSEKELPKIPEGCYIRTLLLQKKANLSNLTYPFFDQMSKLQILDLYKTDIAILPTSTNSWECLKSLYLNGCANFAKLPDSDTTLLNLEFLDIRSTNISSLPIEIKRMVALRCLRASLSTKIFNPNSIGNEVAKPMMLVPEGIIENLKKLEELVLESDQVDDICWVNVAEGLVLELASLEYLTSLFFNFPNVKILDTFVDKRYSMRKKTHSRSNTFRSFNIFIGSHKSRCIYESEISDVQAQRWMRYSEGNRFSIGCEELLKQASTFEIIGHDAIVTLSELDLHSVKVCVVNRCNKFESIVSSDSTKEHIDLLKFEKLYLSELELLECIWKAPACSQSYFSNLTTITINGCHKLTSILNHASAHAFKVLECLKVCDCKKITEIVKDQESLSLFESLTRLRKIELTNLPSLENICKNTLIKWSSLNFVYVKKCNSLKNLSMSSTLAPRITLIYGEQSWWDGLDSNEGLPFMALLSALQDDGASTSGIVKANHDE